MRNILARHGHAAGARRQGHRGDRRNQTRFEMGKSRFHDQYPWE